MKYTNIILTGIFTLMLFNWLDINIINSANSEISGIDLLGIQSALGDIASAINNVALNIN